MNSSGLRTILIHALFWSLYVMSEYAANYLHLGDADHARFIQTTLMSLPVLMLPTYFIVLFAVPRFLKPDKRIQFALILLMTAAFAYWARLKWLDMVNFIYYDYVGSMPASKVLKNVIRDYSVIALAICIYIIGDWRKKDKENKYLVEARARSELELLKRQLHPHFLFNTLNNIYSLALKETRHNDESVKAILKLSNLMEYLVYQSGEDEVKLTQEIELVKNYLDLEVLRYGPELKVDFEVKGVDDNLRTAPLILLPFVENCFKHGGKNEKGIFWVNIRIKVFDNILTVFVTNSKNPNRKQSTRQKSGVGLHNILERLELLYQGLYKLDIEDSQDFYAVNLELKL